MQDPDPPTIGMPFSDWISPGTERTPNEPQALRVLHWLNTRLPRRKLLDDRDDLFAHVYTVCIERFEHRSTDWKGPLATFAALEAKTFFREQSRAARNKQFAEGEDEASAEADVVDHRSDPNVAGREREQAVQAVQQVPDNFDAKWLRHEVEVIRQMPARERTHVTLLLHGWTWREIAAHFGETNFRNVDTNWRHRAEASFRETWKTQFGADSYEIYHADRETKRKAIRQLNDFGHEEGLSQ